MAQSGDEPIGPPKPVVVTNTPANPVPVAGTVTGNVSVSGNVSVTNSPTVKLDSMANTVRVEPGSTEIPFFLNDHDFSVDLIPGLGPIDVSKYKQIRVSFFLYPSSEGDLSFTVYTALPDGSLLELDHVDGGVNPGDRYTKVLDVPGRSIRIFFGATPGKRIGRLAIFGR